MNFYNIVVSIFTLFAVGMVGFFGRRLNIISKEMADNIPKFITHITMPALFIVAMQLPFSWDRMTDLGFLAFSAIAAYGIQFIMAFLVPRMLGVKDPSDIGVYQFMMIFSNAVFMGFPVLLSIFGQEAIFYGAIFNIPFNALVFTLGVFLMRKGESAINIRMFFSPALTATLLGFLLFLFSVEIPDAINDPLAMIGNMTTPLSMVFIGTSLSGVKLSSIFVNKKMYLISAFRLLGIPILLMLVLRLVVTDPLIIGVPVIIMAMPVAALCSIIAKTYGGNVQLAAEGTFMSTLLSMFTIPLVVWILSIV